LQVRRRILVGRQHAEWGPRLPVEVIQKKGRKGPGGPVHVKGGRAVAPLRLGGPGAEATDGRSGFDAVGDGGEGHGRRVF
jgi:hypothetical protein